MGDGYGGNNEWRVRGREFLDDKIRVSTRAASALWAMQDGVV
jgi:hypothetical protein